MGRPGGGSGRNAAELDVAHLVTLKGGEAKGGGAKGGEAFFAPSLPFPEQRC